MLKVSVFTNYFDQSFSDSQGQQFLSCANWRQNGCGSNLNEKETSFSMEKERIQFPIGNQKEFIIEAKKASGKYWKESGCFFGINNNTFQSYWKEMTRISKKDFEKICLALKVLPQEMLEKYTAKELFWDYSSQLKNAGFANLWRIKTKTSNCTITYLNNELLLNNLQVAFSRKDIEKGVILPKELTPLLAEECGMSFGDGFISNKKFEYRLKGNKKDEKEYYTNFVKPMFKELYNIEVNIKDYETTVGFELYSKAIWQFKTNVIGLFPGPKRTIGIPEKLKVNNIEILCSIMRGLFDTDGNIYFRSQGRNKSYYPVISLVTISKNLGNDIVEVLQMLGFAPKLYFDSKITKKCPSEKYTVVLYGYSNFRLYKKLINTRQLKNIAKLKAWEEKFEK